MAELKGVIRSISECVDERQRKDNQEESGNQPSSAEDKSSQDLASEDKVRVLDGGWGWLVCATAFWSIGTVFGIGTTYGIVYVELEKKFSNTTTEASFKISLVGSLCTGLMFLTSMVAGILAVRLGLRKVAFFGSALTFVGLVSTAYVEEFMLLYLTYSIFLGVGSAFVVNSGISVLGHYFRKNLGLVNGIVTCGGPVFALSLSVGLPPLLALIGLRYTILLISSFALVSTLCTLAWIPVFPPRAAAKEWTRSQSPAREGNSHCCKPAWLVNTGIWRRKGFPVWIASMVVACISEYVPAIHVVKFTKVNFPDSSSTLPLICIFIMSAIARLTSGKIGDFHWASRIRMQQTAIMLFGFSILSMPLAENFVVFTAICCVFGIAEGTFICLIGPVAIDLVGPEQVSEAIGYEMGAIAVPVMSGAAICGLLFDNYGDYRIAFHLFGIPPLFGALIMCFIQPLKPTSNQILNKEMEISCSSIEEEQL